MYIDTPTKNIYEKEREVIATRKMMSKALKIEWHKVDEIIDDKDI